MTGLTVARAALVAVPVSEVGLEDIVPVPDSQRFAFGVALAGACAALAAGLLLGGAMKPELASSELPRGPQQLESHSGARTAPAVEQGAALAAYQGQLPDYVLGADARPRSPEPEAVASSPRRAASEADFLPTIGEGADGRDLTVETPSADDAPRA